MSISAMSAAADQLENCRVGYDQGNRWSFLDRQNGRILPDQETDCSAGCGGIALLGGYPVNLEDPFYTGNFKKRLEDAGFHAHQPRRTTSGHRHERKRRARHRE